VVGILLKNFMKIRFYYFFLGIYLPWQVLFGHDVPVHKALTVNAAAAAFDNPPAYTNFLGTVSLDISQVIATNYIVEGRARKVDPVKLPPMGGAGGGYRSLNHFCDPLDTKYGKGLSDALLELRILQGTNSFAWGSVSNCEGIPAHGLNHTHWEHVLVYNKDNKRIKTIKYVSGHSMS
jgi:hypothetical protein